MIKEKTGKGMKAKLLIAILSVALVFTMMPLTMGNAYADDDPVITDGQGEVVTEEAVGADEVSEDVPADVPAVEGEEIVAEPEAVAPEVKSEELIVQAAEETVLIKGNVLKQEKTVSASSLSSLIKENVVFDGINKKSKRGAITVLKGVYFEDLINYIGLKERATIDHFVITTNKFDPGSSTQQETTMEYDWLMTEPNDEFGNGKAMLGFSWDDKGKVTTGTRVFTGAFDGMPLATEGSYQGRVANKPMWIDTLVSIEVVGTVPVAKKGDVVTSAGSTYVVKSAAKKTVAFTKAQNAKKVNVPATIKIYGEDFKVTQVNPKAFTGSNIRTVTLGKNVRYLKRYAFKKSKVKKIIVKSKLMTIHTVSGSLSGSKVKNVSVKVGSKKANKKYVKHYKICFSKKYAGKKARVK